MKGGVVDRFVKALENAAARLICYSIASPAETLDLLGTDERRALALECVVLGRLGQAMGKRRALLFAGGHRPAGTRGMIRFKVAERQGRAPDGAPTRIVLSAIVVNTRAQGELLLWRTSERLVAPLRAGRPGRPLRFADHASVEGALMSYTPDLTDAALGKAPGKTARTSQTADSPAESEAQGEADMGDNPGR